MNPNYYAIIPADVRYDKRLTANQKLLYAELTSLARKEGFAWANNKYLAGVFDVSPRSITRWLSTLQSCGYIKLDIAQSTGNARKVYALEVAQKEKKATEASKDPIDTNDDTYRHGCLYPIDTNDYTYRHNCLYPIDTDGEQNNININNINKNNNINNNPPISPHEKNEDWKNAWEAFIEMRKKKKSPLTDRAKKMLVTELNKLANDTKTQIEILNQSTMNSWKSVYPLHSRGSPKSQKPNGPPSYDLDKLKKMGILGG